MYITDDGSGCHMCWISRWGTNLHANKASIKERVLENTLNQFGVNSVNERFQQHFHRHLLKLDQEKLRQLLFLPQALSIQPAGKAFLVAMVYVFSPYSVASTCGTRDGGYWHNYWSRWCMYMLNFLWFP